MHSLANRVSDEAEKRFRAKVNEWMLDGRQWSEAWPCTALVRDLYREVGIEVPDPGQDVAAALRAKETLYRRLTAAETAAPGDIVQFRDAKGAATHVGFVDAPGRVVHVDAEGRFERLRVAKLLDAEVLRYVGPGCSRLR